MEPIIDAILGALFAILTWWKIEKELHDKGKAKTTWKVWISKNIDDFLYTLVCGAIVGYYRHGILQVIIWLFSMDTKPTMQFYESHEGFILFAGGYFGTGIVKGLLEVGSIGLKWATDKVLGIVKKLIS